MRSWLRFRRSDADGIGTIQENPVEPNTEQLELPIETEDAASEPAGSLLFPPTLRRDHSVNYVGYMLIATLGLFIASSVGWISWLITIPTIAVIVTTFFEGWRTITLAGIAVVASITVIVLFGSTDSQPEEASPPQPSEAEADVMPPVEGSLGIYLDQLTELWNTVDGPTRITKGLTLQNESGEYDAFIYRFDDSQRVAGAYDPDSQAVYALLITGQLSNPGTAQLYLNVCYVVAPFSQECIASYQEEGLAGLAIADYVDTVHTAEWSLGEHIWRLVVENNVLTVRVYGADAA